MINLIPFIFYCGDMSDWSFDLRSIIPYSFRGGTQKPVPGSSAKPQFHATEETADVEVTSNK